MRMPPMEAAFLPTNTNGFKSRHASVREEVSYSASSIGTSSEGISQTEEWQLACRIAASKRFAKSGLLPKFLLYVCEQSLLGNGLRMTEQHIGTQIFNRPTDYNPGEDNIVRSYARMIRKRLEAYFDDEGREERLRIVIARGGYVPSFVAGEPKDLPAASQSALGTPPPMPLETPRSPPVHASAIVEEATERSPVRSWQLLWLTACASMLAGLVLGAAAWSFMRSRQLHVSPELAHPVWAELFQQNRNTLIVPADSGLGILQNLTGKLIPLESYANGSYFSSEDGIPGIKVASLADLREQRYTSVVDLDITAKLMRLPELAAGRTDIRYARSVTTEDLKSSNVILLGSAHTNPWVSLFEDRLNFKLRYMSTVDQSFVENERPLSGEQSQYRNGDGKTGNLTYGVIDYLPNLDGTGHVLIIQGLNMAATQAAADVLFHSTPLKAILAKALRPDGSLQPFELLIQTRSIGATDPGVLILATRIYPT
jgi:hypothetical protein